MTRLSKKPVKYKSLSFPAPLISAIIKHIENDDKFRSVTDFVTQAVREKMLMSERILTELQKSGRVFTLNHVGDDILVGKEVYRLVKTGKNKEK